MADGTPARFADPDASSVCTVWKTWLPRTLATQVHTPGPDHGGFDPTGNRWCDGRHTAYTLARLLAARTWASKLAIETAPLDNACNRALEFLSHRQASDGRLDLGGHYSPNEIGFAMLGLGVALRHLNKTQIEPAENFRARLLTFLQRGAEAVLNGSAYTANHRWTAASAPLAVLHSISPDPRYLAKIEAYLSDGIDLDSDGCWHEERSPNYNHVATAGLLALADHLNRPQLLAPLRRHAEFLLHSLQPNGEMDSTISHRQDRAEADRTPCTFGVARRLALLTDDGRLTSLAHLCWKQKPDPEAELVPLLFQLADHPGPLPIAAPLPESYEKHFQGIQQLRRRTGQTLLSIAADSGGHFFDTVRDQWGGPRRSDDWLHLHHGSIVLETLRLAAAGFANFQPSSLDVHASSAQLEAHQNGWQHTLHFRPGSPPCPMQWDWRTQAEILWRDDGCELSLTSNTPHSLAAGLSLWLRPGLNVYEGACDLGYLRAGQHLFLSGGAPLQLRSHDGSLLEIHGLPRAEHRWEIAPPSAIPSKISEHCTLLFLGLRFPVSLRLRFICSHSNHERA